MSHEFLPVVFCQSRQIGGRVASRSYWLWFFSQAGRQFALHPPLDDDVLHRASQSFEQSVLACAKSANDIAANAKKAIAVATRTIIDQPSLSARHLAKLTADRGVRAQR